VHLPASLSARLKLPLIVAPMFQVSGPDMVVAACQSGAIGAFPTANCRSPEELDSWLGRFRSELSETDAPFCPNLIMASPNLASDVACVIRHRAEIVITSVGSPSLIVGPLHDAGCKVLADVASIRHAEKAIEAGVDGLILLTAGAGGNTGWANGFAFVRAVRAIWDGIVVLAGGVSDGVSLFAAESLGCDLAYMGTSFIATEESLAPLEYREMLVRSTIDDILLTRAFTGLETNMLRPSILAAGIDPETLPAMASKARVEGAYGKNASGDAPRRWRDIWSAGHSVSGVKDIASVGARIAEVRAQYEEARRSACHGQASDGK